MTKRVAGLLALAFGIQLAAQQAAGPTFKSNVEAITLDVRVVDQKGQFVDGLTKDDLTIFEDGREQTIANFERVVIPLGVSASATSEARLYVILMDDLHTNPANSADVRREARDFIEHHFLNSDRAVVLTTSGRVRSAQEFTSDRERLLGAIDRFSGDVGFVQKANCQAVATGPYQCDTAEDQAALRSLTAVATWLAPFGGRRIAVLLFGEGLSSDQAASALGPDPTTATGFQGDEQSGDPSQTPGGIRLAVKVGGANAAYQAVLPLLQQAAGMTARANATVYWLDPRRHPENTFAKIVDDTSSYYLLGYVPTNSKHDGTFRKLEVRTRRSGLHVQARTGYTAKSDAAPARPADVSSALADLMAAPIQVSGLTMSAAAAVFAGANSKASVEVIIDVGGGDLTAASDSGGKGSLDLLVAVTDMNGHTEATERGSLAMTLSAATRDQVAQHGLRVLSRLDVAPGRYFLRVAGVDSGGNSRGSVQYDLDVPDFSKGPLTMSGLALALASDLERPTTGSDKAWQQRFAQPPTTARVFSEGDDILVSGEIYRNDSRLDDVDVTTSVRSAAGEVVFERDQTLTNAGSGAPATPRYQTMIPLQGLDAGDYLLVVEAASSSGATATASQQIPFVVR